MGRFILALILALFISPSLLLAQDEGDDFYDDEGAMDDIQNVEPPPVEPQPDSTQDPAEPSSRFRRPPPFNRSAPPRNSGPTMDSSGDGSVRFELVDPPKYWKPKKRKLHPSGQKPRPSKTKSAQ